MGFVYRASLERENWNSIQFQRFGKESWCDKIHAAIRPNCLLFVYFSVGLVELICIREKTQFERSPMGVSWNSDPLKASLLAAPASLSVPLSNGWFMAQWNSKPLFLDPDGNVNPAAELRKTLEALFSPVESIRILMCDWDFFISVTSIDVWLFSCRSTKIKWSLLTKFN